MGPLHPQRGKLTRLPIFCIPWLTYDLKTTWGSRDGADADDRVRMIKLPRYGSTDPDGRKSETFEYPHDFMQQLPAYETHNTRRLIPLMTTHHD